MAVVGGHDVVVAVQCDVVVTAGLYDVTGVACCRRCLQKRKRCIPSFLVERRWWMERLTRHCPNHVVCEGNGSSSGFENLHC